MQRLMIADDSSVIRKVGRRLLAGLGYNVSEAGDAREALYLCRSDMPDVLIVDAAMDGALELIAGVREASEDGEGRPVRIYLCLVEADLKRMMLGRRAGADDFLLKPFDRAVLTRTFGPLAEAA